MFWCKKNFAPDPPSPLRAILTRPLTDRQNLLIWLLAESAKKMQGKYLAVPHHILALPCGCKRYEIMREGKILGLDREFWLRRSKKNRMWKHDECGESFWIDDLRKTSNVVRILLFDGETELGRTEIELQEPLYASILEGLAGARGSSELIKELTKILKQ